MDHALFLQQSKQGAWDMALVLDVAGIDTQAPADLGIGQPLGRCTFESRIDGGFQISHRMLCEMIGVLHNTLLLYKVHHSHAQRMAGAFPVRWSWRRAR